VSVEESHEFTRKEYAADKEITLCPDGRYLANVNRFGHSYRIELMSVSVNDRATVSKDDWDTLSVELRCEFSPDGHAIVITLAD
jgi:hypothetical protein